MSSDDDFFRQAMADVKPKANTESRVNLGNKFDQLNATARRRAAVAEQAQDRSGLSGGEDHIEMVDPLAILEYKRPGIQHGVYRNLRLGKYSIDARLDLHRYTVDQARQQVYQFVQDCLKHDIRCALITHGKGEGRAQPPILKSCVAHWLPQIPQVQAFHSAQKHHGGTGATYVLVKKSEKKRQQDLERHQKRRG